MSTSLWWELPRTFPLAADCNHYRWLLWWPAPLFVQNVEPHLNLIKIFVGNLSIIDFKLMCVKLLPVGIDAVRYKGPCLCSWQSNAFSGCIE